MQSQETERYILARNVYHANKIVHSIQKNKKPINILLTSEKEAQKQLVKLPIPCRKQYSIFKITLND